eukprot:1166720-Prorocentrum_minimum.AAC.2
MLEDRVDILVRFEAMHGRLVLGSSKENVAALIDRCPTVIVIAPSHIVSCLVRLRQLLPKTDVGALVSTLDTRHAIGVPRVCPCITTIIQPASPTPNLGFCVKDF